MPQFSVIVPSSGCRESLVRVLSAFRCQAGGVCEVLVVWDGTAWPGIEPRFPECHYLHLPTQRGPAVARNAGASAARGEWLVFLDDDVIPDETALEALVMLPNQYPKVQGWAFNVKPHSEVSDQLYVQWAYRDHAHSRPPEGVHTVEPRHFCTSFVAVERHAFLSTDGFDERFSEPGYEDVEWADRAIASGMTVCSAAHVVGMHLKLMDRAWFVNRCHAIGPGLRALQAARPTAVAGRVDWAIQHPRLLHALAYPVAGWQRLLPLAEKLPVPLAFRLLDALALAGMARALDRCL